MPRRKCGRCGRTVKSKQRDWVDAPATAPLGVRKVHDLAVEEAFEEYAYGDDFSFRSPPVLTTRDPSSGEWRTESPYRTSHVTLIFDPDGGQWYYQGKRGHREPIGGLRRAMHWAERIFRY